MGRKTKKEKQREIFEAFEEEIRRLWNPKHRRGVHEKKRQVIAKIYEFLSEEELFAASKDYFNSVHILGKSNFRLVSKKRKKSGTEYEFETWVGPRLIDEAGVTPVHGFLRHTLGLSSSTAFHPHRLIWLAWEREVSSQKFERFVSKHGYTQDAYDLAKRNWKAPKE